MFMQSNSWLSGLNIKYKDAQQINSGNCSLSFIYNMGKSKKALNCHVGLPILKYPSEYYKVRGHINSIFYQIKMKILI